MSNNLHFFPDSLQTPLFQIFESECLKIKNKLMNKTMNDAMMVAIVAAIPIILFSLILNQYFLISDRQRPRMAGSISLAALLVFILPNASANDISFFIGEIFHGAWPMSRLLLHFDRLQIGRICFQLHRLGRIKSASSDGFLTECDCGILVFLCCSITHIISFGQTLFAHRGFCQKIKHSEPDQRCFRI